MNHNKETSQEDISRQEHAVDEEKHEGSVMNQPTGFITINKLYCCQVCQGDFDYEKAPLLLDCGHFFCRHCISEHCINEEGNAQCFEDQVVSGRIEDLRLLNNLIDPGKAKYVL